MQRELLCPPGLNNDGGSPHKWREELSCSELFCGVLFIPRARAALRFYALLYIFIIIFLV